MPPERPEIPRQPEHAARSLPHLLLRALQRSALGPNPEVEEVFQRRLLHDRLDQLIDIQASPQGREQLAHVGQVLEYLWFADTTDPLPPALHRLKVEGDDPIIALNHQLLSEIDFTNLTALLKVSGVNELLSRRRHYIDQNEEQLLPFARALVTQLPGYQFLESFNHDDRRWQETPLTDFERLGAERSIEEYVLKQFKLQDAQDFRFSIDALRTFRRSIQHLDTQTRLHLTKTPAEHTPIHRLKQFFWDAAQQEVGPTVGTISAIRRGYAGSMNITNAQGETTSWITESFFTWAASQQPIDIPTQPTLRNLSTGMIEFAVDELFDDHPPPSLQLLLDDIAETTAVDIVRQCTGCASLKSPFLLSCWASVLFKPQQADITHDSFMVVREESVSRRTQFLTTDAIWNEKKTFEKLKQKVFALVKKRPAYDTTPRLIMEQPSRDDLNDEMSASDLILQLRTKYHTHPHVPGYELRAHNPQTHEFGFIELPEADPYAPCTVPVPDDERLALASKYRRIGLHGLAENITNVPQLTVGELTQLIRQASRYVIPENSDRLSRPTALDQFVPHIKGATLQVQCTGAAHFLRLSLEEIFGAGCCSTVAGNVMDDKHISQVGHEQVFFRDGETSSGYLLDSTPTQSPSRIRMASLALARVFSSSRQSQVPTRRPPRGTTPQATAPAPPPEVARDAYKDLKEFLVTELGLILGKGTMLDEHAVNEIIVRRGPDDLLFRVLSATRLATEGVQPQAEAKAIARLFKELRVCQDQQLLTRFDPDQYLRQPRIASTIQGALDILVKE